MRDVSSATASNSAPSLEAQIVFADWFDDYNAYRPHGSIGYLTRDELMGGKLGHSTCLLSHETPPPTLPEATQL